MPFGDHRPGELGLDDRPAVAGPWPASRVGWQAASPDRLCRAPIASPGSTSQPFMPGRTLSGRPPARVAIDRLSMRHRLERDERAAFVARRMDEDRTPPRTRRADPRPARGRRRARAVRGRARSTARSIVAAERPGADDHPAPASRRRARRPARRAAERGGQHVEPLVGFEPADAEQHGLAGADAVTLPHDARPRPVPRARQPRRGRCRSGSSTSDPAPAADAARPSARAPRRSR